MGDTNLVEVCGLFLNEGKTSGKKYFSGSLRNWVRVRIEIDGFKDRPKQLLELSGGCKFLVFKNEKADAINKWPQYRLMVEKPKDQVADEPIPERATPDDDDVAF